VSECLPPGFDPKLNTNLSPSFLPHLRIFAAFFTTKASRAVVLQNALEGRAWVGEKCVVTAKLNLQAVERGIAAVPRRDLPLFPRQWVIGGFAMIASGGRWLRVAPEDLREAGHRVYRVIFERAQGAGNVDSTGRSQGCVLKYNYTLGNWVLGNRLGLALRSRDG
jgi:hypothetical protein